MKINEQRGSVMMEFIIVFPVNLILLAGTFMVGDLGIRSIWLSLADRVAASDLEELEADGWTTMTNRLLNVSGQDQPSKVEYKNFSDDSFKGPWAFCAGAKAKDDYSLWEVTREQLNAAKGIVGSSARNEKWDDMGGLLLGGTVEVFSKDELDADKSKHTYKFNFYTYKRVRYAYDDWKNTYRSNPHDATEAWHGRLVNADSESEPLWLNEVANESEVSIGDGITGNWEHSSPPNENELTTRKYERYDTFEKWSN